MTNLAISLRLISISIFGKYQILKRIFVYQEEYRLIDPRFYYFDSALQLSLGQIPQSKFQGIPPSPARCLSAQRPDSRLESSSNSIVLRGELIICKVAAKLLKKLTPPGLAGRMA